MRPVLVIWIALLAGVNTIAQAIQIDQSPKVLAGADQVLDLQIAEILEKADWPQRAKARGLKVRGDSIQVLVSTSDAQKTAAWIRTRGGAHILLSGDRVQAWVPDRHLRDLSLLDSVVWIGQPDYAVVPRPLPSERTAKEGTVTSEGVAAMAAPAWHDAGFIGEGIHVGVIDVGFENHAALIGSDLPPAERLIFQSFGGSSTAGDHGSACAEIVYDVAPGITLYLAQVATAIDVEQALDWLGTNNVRVATMSLGFHNSGPGDGTGAMYDAIRAAVQQGDLLFANSAGNERQNHWQGETIDSDGNGWVEFNPGEELNIYARSFSADDKISLNVVWNDWEITDQDYSLHLFKVGEDGATEEVAMADRAQSGVNGQLPVENLRFTVVDPGRYGIGIFRKQVTGNNDLEVFDSDWDLGIIVEEGSLTAPADSSDVMAVAALNIGSDWGYRDFSSAGPANGPGGSFDGGLIKPDIGAYDGVTGVSLGRWYGTSAACPHVAGGAALVMQSQPSWSYNEVRSFLEERAIDKGSFGFDNDYGWGRLSLGQVPGLECSYALTPTSAEIAANSTGGFIQVSTDENCFWTATSQMEWLRIGPDSRVGSGMVLYSADANLGSDQRQGILRVAGHDFIVTQLALSCEIEVSPTTAAFAAEGGTGSIEIAIDAGCDWTASSSEWIDIIGDFTGNGNGSLEYTVQAHEDVAERAGTIEINEAIVEITQAGATQSWSYIVGGIADIPGAENTSWNSDLSALNAGDRAASMQLSYHYEGGVAYRVVDIGVGEVIEWAQAPVSLFGLERSSSGVVEVNSDQPLIVTARTYNVSTSGTYGQYLPGIEDADTLKAGESAVLVPLVSNDLFRTNVGFVNVNTHQATGVVQLYDPDGEPIGSPVEVVIAARGWSQKNRIFNAAGAGSCDGCSARVEVLGGGGLWAYASVLDAGSGDPTTIPQVVLGQETAETRWLVAGIADAEGSNETRWKSTLAAFNAGAETSSVSLGYRSSAGDVDLDIDLVSGGIKQWGNVVVDLFGSPLTSGAVEVVAPATTVVSARTYNESTEGTFGQFLPAVTQDQAIGAGGFARLTQLKRSDEFRTNIGFVNFGDQACQVSIWLYDGSGTHIGAGLSATVPAGGWTQRNRVFEAAGVAESAIAYAEVSVVDAGCLVWAYASVVDNESGDPTTIPMAVTGR